MVRYELLSLSIRTNMCEGTWFDQPKYMPDWLYKYFGNAVGPILFQKEGWNFANL